MGYLPPDPPPMIEITCLSDAAPRYIEAYPSTQKRRLEFPLRSPDQTPEILRQARIGAAIILAIAATLLTIILQTVGVL